jgi:quercetin dioxygenase-like cupin family protein
MTTLEQINKVKAMQLTIDKMLDRGTLALKDPRVKACSITNSWVLEPLYQDNDCSVGFVHIANVELGPCEAHIHRDAREYLIVVKGSILLNVEGRDIRIVREGECASVEAGSLHHSKPLTDDTKLAYICVPRDMDIPLFKEKFNNV